MSRKINFTTGKQSWQAGITKVDRNKVYGYIDEEVTDINGDPCSIANMLDDGNTIVLQGLTAMKTVDPDNKEVDKKSLKAVYMDGTDADIVPSSFQEDVKLSEATIDDLFDLEVSSIYQLGFEDSEQEESLKEELKKGKLYRFIFNFRAGYEGADAILLANNEGIFALTGRMLEFAYLENKAADIIIDDDDDEDDDEMDFSML